jgi:hypothetical protein
LLPGAINMRAISSIFSATDDGSVTGRCLHRHSVRLRVRCPQSPASPSGERSRRNLALSSCSNDSITPFLHAPIFRICRYSVRISSVNLLW